VRFLIVYTVCIWALKELLRKVAAGELSVDEAEKLLRVTAIREIEDFAKLDVNRESRNGVPEIILGDSKTPEQLIEIVLRLLHENGRVIVSRADKHQIESLREAIPEDATLTANEKTGMLVVRSGGSDVKMTGGRIGLLTAGTSDIPVAEEARVVAEEMGCEVISAYDVGVAGLHRLFPHLKNMIEKRVDVIIAVAGREGALPAVVAGLVHLPVIAVPTSIGYGFGEKGISALTAMLQACSLGLAVVNIDGGVAAGALAALIANQVAEARRAAK
jgi:NCAIR mutase (PurE)-related protein